MFVQMFQVTRLAREAGIKSQSFVSHTLYDLERILASNQGRSPSSYRGFQTLLSRLGSPAQPVPEPNALPSSGNLDWDGPTQPPTLAELGVEEGSLGPSLYPGGETEALKRMEREVCQRGSWVRGFEKPNTSPNSLQPSTTVLSPYLKFGCLSVRRLYWRLEDLCSGKKHTQPPVSLTGQLLWREFYYACSLGTRNFGRMEGNTACRQIPWRRESQILAAWEESRTGFPFIDAIMTQLRQEGWIHHLARHAVACFLTRGDLWQHWEDGARVFEKYLLDADYALNNGNWQWLSASAFFHQYWRIYSPVAFGKKTDPNGDYIRKYVQNLAKYPAKYVFKPWTAPKSVQETAQCIIGVDYPKPIVDHSKVSKENMERMKKAYASSGEPSAKKAKN